MKVGDLVWFDSFYHKRPLADGSPSEYSLKGIIVKEYGEEERIHVELKFDVLIDGNIYPVPSDCLVLVNRPKESI